MTPLASLSLSLEGPSLITAHGERANAERVRRRAADCGTRETEKGPLLVLNCPTDRRSRAALFLPNGNTTMEKT
ncbi:hypothetical protein LMH87_000308 [Akanthomyces muscarius]|uniref:Uncharacterized protein n=1 Tax=Akanthomyces muscarius TaxID=2231603 RepID=A0A9W8QGJ2_AKAMU|nr:hypothetical protein LMH87_000308 [Akanthomyces muscarius]KAJ4155042.1 hypothetical protein LMH87_000308 [Akanthomyces muscarius]